jgi:hypothetical protein
MGVQCNRCQELSSAVDEVPANLVSLMKDQHAAFRQRDHSAFMRIDKELELMIGHKERSIGALREHRRSHEESDLSLKAS